MVEAEANYLFIIQVRDSGVLGQGDRRSKGKILLDPGYRLDMRARKESVMTLRCSA